MNKSLTTYINEAVKRHPKLADLEEIVYPDGTVINMDELEEKFRLACFIIYSQYSFMAPALKALVPVFTNTIDTMATDGVRLLMNPRFTYGLNDTECVFVLLHECMHNVLNHIVRKNQAGHTDRDRSNIAADFEVNGILEDTGMIKEGTTKKLNGLINPKYSGWAYERIYADPELDRLAQSQSPKDQQSPSEEGNGSGNGSGSSGGSNSSQSHGPDWEKGWNDAIADYNSGKLKI